LILTDNLKNTLPEFDPAPWASLHILRNERPLGFAKNHNRAFELARGDYFAILNPDLVFERPVFEPLLNILKKHQADLIAPKIVDEAGALQDSCRPLPTPFELIRRRLPGYTFKPYLPDADGIIHPDWIAGMFWLVRSKSYRQLGGMDETYRLYFEDVDFCTRARQRGMRLMVTAQLQVRHDAQRSSRRKLYYLFLHSQSALRFFLSPVYRQARRAK
jgi:N-acetylglucosaminyl-diphospho-decaprenol L-rhamnosyltransferase